MFTFEVTVTLPVFNSCPPECTQDYYFFSSNWCAGTFLLETWERLSYLWMIISDGVFRGLPDTAESSCSLFMAHAGSTTRTVVCMLVTQREMPSGFLGVWWWISQPLQRCFCLWIDTKLFLLAVMIWWEIPDSAMKLSVTLTYGYFKSKFFPQDISLNSFFMLYVPCAILKVIHNINLRITLLSRS